MRKRAGRGCYRTEDLAGFGKERGIKVNKENIKSFWDEGWRLDKV